MKKLTITLLISFLAVLAFGCGYNSSEDCSWCGGEPTKGFKTATGEDCYVCENCATTCFLCDGKATEHFTNNMGTITFLCDDCYEEMTAQ